MINCLKTSGMKISEIKQFINWCNEGKSSIDKRLNMFYEQEKNIKEQIKVLTKSLKLIKFKQCHHKKAKDGIEEIVKNLRVEEKQIYSKIIQKSSLISEFFIFF